MIPTQALFRDALLDPAQRVPDDLIDGRNRPAGKRFDVYRNNVAVSLTEALVIGFPVVTRLLGRENMDGLARLYQRAHPPTSALMMHFGERFPEFLAQMPQLSHLGYLPDVARLELALRRSYHAADSVAMDPAQLASVDPDRLTHCTLGLAPAVGLLRSPWPIHAIWRFNTEDGAPKPAPVAQDVLVTRQEFDPVPRLLPPGAAIWMASIQKGRTIGEALDCAVADCLTFDLSATLTLLLTDQAIVSLNLKD